MQGSAHTSSFLQQEKNKAKFLLTGKNSHHWLQNSKALQRLRCCEGHEVLIFQLVYSLIFLFFTPVKTFKEQKIRQNNNKTSFHALAPQTIKPVSPETPGLPCSLAAASLSITTFPLDGKVLHVLEQENKSVLVLSSTARKQECV